jgi:hypothetical protein
MSLSAVLKRAGHECLMFDQANPETPNSVIVEEIQRKQPALVGLSFLSTTSYPYAKILAREIRAANRTRPVIRLLDYMADRPDAFSISGKRGSRFTFLIPSEAAAATS